MILATVVFIVLAVAVIGGTSYALHLMSKRTDQIYREVMLDDAEWAVKNDRATLEAEAVSMASMGWEMPDFIEHQRAARATMELYDLEQEMLADLWEAIAIVESWA